MNEQNDDNTRTHSFIANGTMVAHYRIIEKIGAGGMGEVYLAEDTKLGRRVALKFLPSHLISNDEIKKRFLREAQAVAKLNHPNIVTVHEVGEHNDRPYFVMEHIEGKSLHYYSHKESLPVDTIVEFAIQICQGLGDAHRNDITHRDIKAANIAIDKNNRIRILDFGLAAIPADQKLTKTGSTLGTVAYMSPEQVTGREIDHRSDLFSLGVVLYELLAGQSPFKRDNEGATLRAIIEEAPEPISRYKANIPEKLQEIILKLLEKDKEIRYQTAEGVIADLKRLMYDSQPTASVKRPSEKKNNLLLPLTVAFALVVVVGIWAIFFKESDKAADIKEPVLIVLPFENLGSDEDDFFAYGIRDEIGSRLSTTKGLRVIAQRSADKYKGTDKSIAEIGEETGADYVLEATIRWDKSADVDRIRITPRLTKTEDNYLMWADNYEQQLVEIFAVQSKIAEQIVMSLGLTLVRNDQSAPEDAPTKNLDAYNYYLRGLEFASNTFKMTDFHESIKMFDSAIALDSSFTLAWAQKSINHSTFNFHFTTVDARYHKEQARLASEKALSLNPNLPSVQIAAGTYSNYIEREYEKALESFNAAKSEMTSNADLSQSIGIVKLRQGKWDEALQMFEDAIRIDPLTDRRYYYLANCLGMTRDYDEAEKYIDRALVLDPKNADAAFIKLSLNLFRYGTLEYGKTSFEKLTDNIGLAEIGTYELSSSTSLGLWRFVIDQIDPKEAIKNVRGLGEIRGVITERSPHMVHLNIAQLYELSGHRDSAMIHYDSARIILTNIVDFSDPEFHTFSELGITYALMGVADSAVYYGNLGKETLSIDECHW